MPRSRRQPGTVYFGSNRDLTTWPLSNMSLGRIITGGKRYASAEHLYQSKKFELGAEHARHNGQPALGQQLSDAAEAIRRRAGPRKCKTLAHQSENLLPAAFLAEWEAHIGVQTMHTVLQIKFHAATPAGVRARAALLNTGNRQLVQIADDCPVYGVNPRTLQGGNLLGTMLMALRTQLRQEGYQPGM